MDIHQQEALLWRYASGDARAAQAVASQFLPPVYRHARRLLGDDAEAEEVAQEAMMRLWRIAPNWQGGRAKVSTWLYQVTANLCMDRLRKRRQQGTEDVPDSADDHPAAEEILQARSREQALQEALKLLPDRQRQAVVLRHLDGLSNPEIASIMGISPRAVESLTARGKRALAAVLCERRFELGFENET